MIPDWQHAQNEDERLRLESRGFRFFITAASWVVYFGDRKMGHGECGPNEHGLYLVHARASRRVALADAIACAKRVKL